MRVLIDARPTIGLGGVSRVAQALIAAYAERFPQTELILATTGWKTPQLDSGFKKTNCRRVHLQIPNKLWSLNCMLGMTSLDSAVEKRLGKIDAVFLPNLGFVSRLKQPYTLLLHDLSFLIEPRWFSRKMCLWHHAVHAKQLIKNAAHLLSVSETTKQDTIRLLKIPAEKISVIPLGSTLKTSIKQKNPSCFPKSARDFGASARSPICHLEHNATDLSAPSDSAQDNILKENLPDRYVLLLGGDDPRKNAATGFEAVRLLKKDPLWHDLTVIIVSSKQIHFQESWIQQITKPSDQELASLYQRAAIFLYPSWYEGYGLPLHEAAHYGTPRIASTAGALPETAPPGTIFADPTKPHHWAEALVCTLTTPRSPTPMETFNWNRAVEILQETLQRIAS